MVKGMNINRVKKNRFKAAFNDFMLTLMGGHKQRWKTIRRLALVEPEQQKKRS